MRTIIIADDDSLVEHLDQDGTDLLLSLGDLWDSTIEKAHRRYQPKKTFAVKGNHDSNAPFASNITSLHNTGKTFDDVTFGGFGGNWRYKPHGHHLFDQFEVSSMLRAFPRVDVFVSHNSPRGVHERDDDVHQGFDAFVDYIDRHQPAYFIHGHQHLNQVTRIGLTQVVGVFGELSIELKVSRPV
jgi:Icc-related predicted phosphoesterase